MAQTMEVCSSCGFLFECDLDDPSDLCECHHCQVAKIVESLGELKNA